MQQNWFRCNVSFLIVSELSQWVMIKYYSAGKQPLNDCFSIHSISSSLIWYKLGFLLLRIWPALASQFPWKWIFYPKYGICIRRMQVEEGPRWHDFPRRQFLQRQGHRSSLRRRWSQVDTVKLIKLRNMNVIIYERNLSQGTQNWKY